MQVADMARKAQISRDTAHRALKETLKETGEMTWKEKQAWAGEVMAHIPGGDHEKNEFRMFVNMLLLKALGKNPEGLPQSVEGLLDEATRDMKTIAGKPNFKPEYDPVILALPWPGAANRQTGGRARRPRGSTQDAAREAEPDRERSSSLHPARPAHLSCSKRPHVVRLDIGSWRNHESSVSGADRRGGPLRNGLRAVRVGEAERAREAGGPAAARVGDRAGCEVAATRTRRLGSTHRR
jgi:hypothetical protein